MDWYNIREPLGTNGLKEGAATAVTEQSPVRKARPSTDVTSTALGKENLATYL
jgi:hypothetical protein